MRVLLLHGGPGAPGTLSTLRRALADERVEEPLQRRGARTVEEHVRDLDAVVGDGPVALVGHSWGAMLGLAYAARHPAKVERLVLVGCGTFDEEARAELVRRREARLTDGLRERLREIEQRIDAEPGRADALYAELGALFVGIDGHDPAAADLGGLPCDREGARATWEDMVRLQREGVYPAAFAAIEAPVVMLHGEDDPHPGALIRDGLAPLLKDFRYRSFARCGHYPWLERHAKDDFLAALRAALPP